MTYNRVSNTVYQQRYRARHPERVRAQREAFNVRRKARGRLIVYAWAHPSGRVDYVGRGLTDRPAFHRRKPWWTPEHTLLSMTCADEWAAMEAEGRWGAHYRPAHNRDGYRHTIVQENAQENTFS